MASTTEEAATTGPAVDRLSYLIRRNLQIMAERLPYVTLLLNVHGNTVPNAGHSSSDGPARTSSSPGWCKRRSMKATCVPTSTPAPSRG